MPYETVEVADGRIKLAVANDDLWQRFCKAAERPDLAADARYLKAADRVRNREELVPIVRALAQDAHPRRLDGPPSRRPAVCPPEPSAPSARCATATC